MMKRFIGILILGLTLNGCPSVDLAADHVKKERATYNALQPFIAKGISASTELEARAGAVLNDSWDARLTSYELRLKNRETE